MTDEDANKLRVLIKEELTASENRVIGEVGKFVEDNLFPMIEEKADKTDIDRLDKTTIGIILKNRHGLPIFECY